MNQHESEKHDNIKTMKKDFKTFLKSQNFDGIIHFQSTKIQFRLKSICGSFSSGAVIKNVLPKKATMSRDKLSNL